MLLTIRIKNAWNELKYFPIKIAKYEKIENSNIKLSILFKFFKTKGF